jgi:ABC-type cobalamin/Fe3+-siderophores transport system ATPase subunit
MNNDIFQNGATWLRADFHLHTKADKEFQYSDAENYYFSNYVASLEKAGIAIGVITNHNKFNFEEFKALRKTAAGKNIFLLPGVELSVNDGANGIHTLVVFSDKWLENGQDYINQFLNVAFKGKIPSQYENENGRSSLNLIETIRELEGYQKDFFLIFAHVEDASGLWNELDGGRLQELGKNEFFRRRALGFQKVRTHDKPDEKCQIKVQKWLGTAYPAEVEGSDPKQIEEIGKGKKCFLKLGALTFDAVKFALLDHKNRLNLDDPPAHAHSHLRSIAFSGGIFDGKTLAFSPELNSLIGIRGSGKSAILEIIRYALDIPFGENASDQKYKNELVKYALNSGGKVVLHAIDRFGHSYNIERILNEAPDVYSNDKIIPGVSIRETVLHKPLYFGQKDLSSTGEGFERDLVEKLVATKLVDVRRRIAAQQIVVRQSVAQLLNIGTATTRIGELSKEKQDIEHRLKVFTEHGIEAKLQKRLDFDADTRFMQNGIASVQNLTQGAEAFLADFSLPELSEYVSKHNPELLKKFLAEYETAKAAFGKIVEQLQNIKKAVVAMKNVSKELSENKRNLAEEFAEIERRLAQELTSENLRVSSDDFLKLKQRQAKVEQELSLLSKTKERKENARRFLLSQLAELGKLWHEEFSIIQSELAAVGKNSEALKIACEYKGNKAAFLDFTKNMFRGSNIREQTFQGVVEKYADFIELFKGYADARSNNLLGSNPELFKEWFKRNLAEFLTYQVPSRFAIQYHGKELKQHSLGQRASALILFVLSQNDNDIILIDQPEDDLDNQTIYEDVIKLVHKLKPSIQFILATHNPNIPVLGDAEQILACSFAENAVSVQSGSIDDPAQQQTIVNIMEGGKEAFNKRKEIYQSWNS